jgi:hypothetical protein
MRKLIVLTTLVLGCWLISPETSQAQYHYFPPGYYYPPATYYYQVSHYGYPAYGYYSVPGYSYYGYPSYSHYGYPTYYSAPVYSGRYYYRTGLLGRRLCY